MRDKINKGKTQKLNKKVTIITLLCVIITLLFFSVIFSLVNMANNKIIYGVKIEGIEVSNLTRRRSKIKSKGSGNKKCYYLLWRFRRNY